MERTDFTFTDGMGSMRVWYKGRFCYQYFNSRPHYEVVTDILAGKTTEATKQALIEIERDIATGEYDPITQTFKKEEIQCQPQSQK